MVGLPLFFYRTVAILAAASPRGHPPAAQNGPDRARYANFVASDATIPGLMD
jgi:hypothetical protein